MRAMLRAMRSALDRRSANSSRFPSPWLGRGAKLGLERLDPGAQGRDGVADLFFGKASRDVLRAVHVPRLHVEQEQPLRLAPVCPVMNMCELVGNPCSSTMTGSSGSRRSAPASRYVTLTPSIVRDRDPRRRIPRPGRRQQGCDRSARAGVAEAVFRRAASTAGRMRAEQSPSNDLDAVNREAGDDETDVPVCCGVLHRRSAAGAEQSPNRAPLPGESQQVEVDGARLVLLGTELEDHPANV